jgi:cell division septum initiation protein DivIVA
MPQIIVLADTSTDSRDRSVMFTERVNSSDFESGHFRAQLAERLAWAVADAHDIEQRPPHERASDGDRLETPSAETAAAAETELAHEEPVARETRELSAVLS